MKTLLVICNIFLTCFAVWSLHQVFSGGEAVEYTVGRERHAGTSVSDSSGNTADQPAELSVNEAKNSLLHNDVFALSRCPSLENNAQTMTLAGIIITEETRGAIIIQSANTRNGPPGMNNRRPGNGGNNNDQNKLNQRYFHVGEAINDQYTLASVSRTSVTLTGPTGTRVLELQKASAGAGTNNNPGRNFGPQFIPPWMMGPQGMMMMPWMMGPQGNMMPGNMRGPRGQFNGNFGRGQFNGNFGRGQFNGRR